MTWILVLASRIGGLFRRNRLDEQLDEELLSHMEMMVEDNVRRGMTQKEAWRKARLSFGCFEQTKEIYRNQRGLPMIETLVQDFRFAFRVLRKNASFTAVAVIALTLGIGANTVIFSVVNAVLLRSLPFKQADRLFALWERSPKLGFDQYGPAPANLTDWRMQNNVFEDIAAYFPNVSLGLAGDNNPEHVTGVFVSANLFHTLRVEPIKGRVFLPEEEDPGKSQVAIISQGLWERRFANDSGVVGRTITMNGANYTVVGIMPAGFQFPGGVGTINKVFTPQPADVWLPYAQTPTQLTNRQAHSLLTVARLKPGVSAEQAQAEMNTIQRRIEQQYPTQYLGSEVKMVPFATQVSGPVRPVLLVLLGAVAFVLLIACVNVANLLLARASSRRKEIAIRGALGASRIRVIRQLLTESVLLSAAGGLGGVLLAGLSLKLLTVMLPANFPRAEEINIDLRVLGFTLAISLATGIIFGLAPAIRASKFTLTDALKEGGGGSTEGRSRNRFRGLLVMAEMALSLILLVGAGLMIQSFFHLRQVNAGFNPEHVLTVSLSLPQANYPTGIAKNAFFQRLIEQSRALPGVISASATTQVPLSGELNGTIVKVDGRTYAPGASPLAQFRAVTSEYFDTMKVPLVKGRVFSERDTRDSAPIVVINQTMARTTFPEEDPIGKRLVMFTGFIGEIVGVVGDIKERGLDEKADETVFVDYAQLPLWSNMVLTIRTAGDPMAIAGGVRSALASVDKNQPVTRIKTMDELVSGSVAESRFRTLLLGLFALTALALAVVGIYGVMSYSAGQRTHEIGIRMALGASRGDVLKLVVGQGMFMASIGAAAGLIGSYWLTRLLSDFLYQIKATDLPTFAGTTLLLMVVAMLACLIPALKVARVDPTRALRHE